LIFDPPVRSASIPSPPQDERLCLAPNSLFSFKFLLGVVDITFHFFDPSFGSLECLISLGRSEATPLPPFSFPKNPIWEGDLRWRVCLFSLPQIEVVVAVPSFLGFLRGTSSCLLVFVSSKTDFFLPRLDRQTGVGPCRGVHGLFPPLFNSVNFFSLFRSLEPPMGSSYPSISGSFS